MSPAADAVAAVRRMTEWLAESGQLLANRRVEQAAVGAQTFVQEVQALRAGHVQHVDRASQALDEMLFAARSAMEVIHGEASASQDDRTLQDWLESVGTLQHNFELQARAWMMGGLPRQDFLRGHEAMVQHVLDGLALRLELSDPHDLTATVWQAAAALPAEQIDADTTHRIERPLR